MTTQTLEAKTSAQPVCLYMALELSAKDWKVAFSDGSCARARRRSVAAGEMEALRREIEMAEGEARIAGGCAGEERVRSWSRWILAAPSAGRAWHRERSD